MTAQVSLPESVTVAVGAGGLEVVRVASSLATAEVHKHGATLCSWRPANADEVIFLSPRAVLDGSAAIRGGVPICAPWFGPGRHGDKKPAHGFLRTAEWQLASAADREGVVTLRFELTGSGPDQLPGGAAYVGARFAYTVSVGSELALTLSVTAGEAGIEVEEALHTYVRVGDVRRVRIDGLDGAGYVDKVDGGTQKRQAGPVVLVGETDRVYAAQGPVRVTDPVLGRVVEVRGAGSANVVVWNPWQDKAIGMPDLGDAWSGFVCVETANVLDDSLVVPAGETVELTQRIAVSR